jgi:hypothetical protein
MPIVQRMTMFAMNPMMSRMMPRMINSGSQQCRDGKPCCSQGPEQHLQVTAERSARHRASPDRSWRRTQRE